MGMRAFERGYQAAEAGQPIEANPYAPLVKYQTRKRKVFRRRALVRENPAWADWNDGWKAGYHRNGPQTKGAMNDVQAPPPR